jgi:heat-inducible transcriptional repressor
MEHTLPAAHRPLTEREKLILHAVVHTYITTAEAVGSRTIVKRYGMDLSPATVRNVMADLEDIGFLKQIHSSSGRVPTDKGYRYYVDYLMKTQELTLAERARIEDQLSRQLNDLDSVMRQTCHMLALISEQTSIVESPDDTDAEVRRIELIPITADKVAVLTADNYAQVHTLIVDVDKNVTVGDLSRLSAFLNEHFTGTPLADVKQRVESRMKEYVDEQRRLAEQALVLLMALPHSRVGQVFLEGTSHLLDQPEFRDITKAREMFTLLEERNRLTEILRQRMGAESGPRLSVLIGSDDDDSALQDISFVTAPYQVRGKPLGLVGVIGPRRMPYSKVTALVDYTAGVLSSFLTRRAS